MRSPVNAQKCVTGAQHSRDTRASPRLWVPVGARMGVTNALPTWADWLGLSLSRDAREQQSVESCRARQGWYGFDGYTPPLRSGRGTFGLTQGKLGTEETHGSPVFGGMLFSSTVVSHPWSPRRPRSDHLRSAVSAVVLGGVHEAIHAI